MECNSPILLTRKRTASKRKISDNSPEHLSIKKTKQNILINTYYITKNKKVLKNKDLTGATMIGVKGNISKGVEPNKLPQGYVIADDDSNNTRQIVGNGANISDNSAFGDSNLGSALGATIENDFTSTKYKKDENNKIVCKPQYNSNGEECVDICKGETSTLTLILKNSQNQNLINRKIELFF